MIGRDSDAFMENAGFENEDDLVDTTGNRYESHINDLQANNATEQQ